MASDGKDDGNDDDKDKQIIIMTIKNKNKRRLVAMTMASQTSQYLTTTGTKGQKQTYTHALAKQPFRDPIY